MKQLNENLKIKQITFTKIINKETEIEKLKFKIIPSI